MFTVYPLVTAPSTKNRRSSNPFDDDSNPFADDDDEPSVDKSSPPAEGNMAEPPSKSKRMPTDSILKRLVLMVLLFVLTFSYYEN